MKTKPSVETKYQIKVGDLVRATKDCGHTKKGEVYKVVLDRIDGQGTVHRYKGAGKLAINPVTEISEYSGKKMHSHCREIDTWELVKKGVTK